jgi:aminopeptidase N
MLKNSFFGLVLFVLTACGGQGQNVLEAPVQTLPAVRVESGVSLDLAKARAAAVSRVNYALKFRVPADASAPISASQTLTFDLKSVDHDLQLDFREDGDRLKMLEINGVIAAIDHREEHLILPAAALQTGANTVVIDFVAGDTSLNRNPDYLYTLFVPDRARTVFPVFDQPNLKATYDLTLDLPANWVALGNGPLVETIESEAGRKVHKFARSDRLSTYLFSFVAGAFETVTRTIDGREMTMLHRETNTQKLARNVDDIFQAHADALNWLEDYTGIAYPFQKFDFALIPTFQYGGMEHVGAIQYRASTLLLDESPSDPQKLNRANLIAHETAHMWFGDLVTMDWFNDVWTKEVFANFMAAKIVNPSFPAIDHDLNFLLRSYPAAYAVDRTSGANPIRQDLPNLNEAGTLYGGIIYNKAPIMMKQLELLIGEEAFRSGMREYLSTYAGRNATWPNLIEILDKRSDQDLKAWSEVWVNTPGRPHFEMNEAGNGLIQIDPLGQGRIWDQQFDSIEVSPEAENMFGQRLTSDQLLGEPTTRAAIPALQSRLLINSDGAGYGLFPVNLSLAETVWPKLSDLQKGAQLINLFEQMLEGHEDVTPTAYMTFLQNFLNEPNELLLNRMLAQLRRVYWSFLAPPQREAISAPLERVLWAYIQNPDIPASTRKIYFQTLQDIALNPASIRLLKTILDGEQKVVDLSFSPREQGNLAALLAIKLPKEADEILGRHMAWLSSPDERRRFRFIMPALSADPAAQDAFFAALMDVENRAIESWVVDALAYLHHPQRTETSKKYIPESLALMEEIQVTGDIFFPARWIGGTLQNHTSGEAAQAVRSFLSERPDYNYQLKLKILQAADMLYRAEEAQSAPQ